ncbi:tripartite tricarboxylate transporter TctB family protein [Oscillibacter sp.]|uniref:tripartite tricarboxylate transporter TctB family protein n=1 Tax=Oscillibacter sp. TaxID=1945593 RepID=UPI001B6B7B81|nr:tripartite tricarboxylate transporter TctB family protein [Oscillibacter sp.]MBP3508401.1 tripartite tricarboxylate transporter TctB family protein [Oscillibacter sp.]MDD6605891.1 tripartite tricarboxylate transporter TctB family protein [Oscillospiraceae bacterium]
MKIKYNTEMISGAIFAILGAVLWFLIPTQVQTLEKTVINAQTFPRIAIGGLFLFSVGLLLEGLFAREKKEVYITKESFRSVAFKKELRSILFALFLIAYCFLVGHLGYVVTTVLLVLAVMLFYGARKWYYYAIPLGMVGIVYYVFKVLLRISLP